MHEPAVAIDAHNPDFLVAGANDWVDQQDCPRTSATQKATCIEFNASDSSGISGVYFSFDRGDHWTQPTYTGWTRAACVNDPDCPGSFGPSTRFPGITRPAFALTVTRRWRSGRVR